jgi:aminoacrylate hydrolase
MGVEDLAERAAAFLPANLPGFVCGESFGSAVALTLARRFPERVRGLVVLSGFAHHPTASRVPNRAIVSLWSLCTDHAPLLAHLERIVGMPASLGRPVSPATIRAYLRQPLMPGAEYREKLRLVAGFDARPWLHELECPTIVIHGRRDLVVPVTAGRELSRLLSRSTFSELPCGHLAYLAMPTQIRRAVDEWRAAVDLG